MTKIRAVSVVFGPTMLQYDGREHVVRRTIIAPELVGKRLDGYKVLIERNATKLIDRFKGRDEADLVAQANGTAFGLACGIWTENFQRAWRMGRALEAGSVWINTYKQSVTSTPFGGFKNSGIGREKGIDGLRLYAQVKSMYFGLHAQPLSVAK